MQRPSEELIRAAVNELGGVKPAARYLRENGYDVSEGYIRRRHIKPGEDPYEVELPEGKEAKPVVVEELIARRIKEFERKREIYNREKLIQVRVKLDGPIGIGFQGDVHLDDDGTDLKKVFDDLDLFDGRHEGLFAAGLGDIVNNWMGKLAHLWSQQSTSHAEAIALAEAYLQRVDWLFFILGNHDAWSGRNDLYREMIKNNTRIVKDGKVRVALRLPNGRNVKIYAVHGFSGKSMWTPVYGALKAAQLDGMHHDIYVGGHTHVAAYSHGMRPSSEQIWHALQVASYKTLDRYAEELNLPPHDMYTCPVALIDPYAKSEINFIRFEFDPHEAAERLAWMRSRWAAGKSSS